MLCPRVPHKGLVFDRSEVGHASTIVEHALERALLGRGDGQVPHVLDLDPHLGIRAPVGRCIEPAISVDLWKRVPGQGMTYSAAASTDPGSGHPWTG